MAAARTRKASPKAAPAEKKSERPVATLEDDKGYVGFRPDPNPPSAYSLLTGPDSPIEITSPDQPIRQHNLDEET